jgi:cobaltochelatase CobN
VQGISATSSRADWQARDNGLSPMDTAMQVAVPEFDGRVVTVPFSFKETDADGLPSYVADPERAGRVAGVATRLARLRGAENADKRVVIMLSNYPTKHSRIGNGVGLVTPASAVATLDALTAAGYDTGEWDQADLDGDGLMHRLIAAGGFDTEFLTEDQLAANPARLAGERYKEWFAEFPGDLQQAVIDQWGPPPGQVQVHDGDLTFACLQFGNVLLAIQPPRGFGENPVAIYHDPDLAPTHHYLGCYRWLDRDWGADAVIHLGKHGTLEWLPGKSLGLSASCAPDALLGDLPLFYPFVVNDPGEGTQAKRRTHAVILDHLVAPMTRAETYDELARLESMLDEYYEVQTMDPAKERALQGEIWQLLRSAELAGELGRDQDQIPDDFDEMVVELDGYLCELKDVQMRGGLHTFGSPPAGEDRLGLVLAMLGLPQAGRPGLRQAIAAVYELSEAELQAGAGEKVAVPEALLARFPGPGRTASDALDRLEEAARALVEKMEARSWSPLSAEAVAEEVLGVPAPAVAETLAFAAAELVPRLDQCERELTNLLAGLDGAYIPSGPSGSPTRGRADVLPTGKNFYSVDPKALPSELSWQVGWQLADDLVERYRREEGAAPASIGLIVWGTAAMRTHGDDIAEALALLGVRPVWQPESRRVTGLELIPVAELGRPRVDVTVRISGFFRDAFPHLVTLIDDAVAMVADADEEDEADNPVAAAVAADRAQGASERSATTRIFGSKPGAYGAGLLPLIDARNWHSEADLAEVYATWGGYAYGRGLDGVEARADMQRALTRIQVAVKNADSREHDVLDSDDYFQYHGGMVAAVRSAAGSAPKAYVGDSADPSRVRTRDLAEETARVFRSRVANPKWIEAMKEHGYKGAFELSATVDYLFGYDATAGVVADWMYATLGDKYVLDEDTRAFMAESNPWALRAVTERLLEAADRGLWAEPDPQRLAQLRATYLEQEGEIEAGTAAPTAAQAAGARQRTS